ncbi:hypothetical protein D3C86_1780160 [compost metagenome]
MGLEATQFGVETVIVIPGAFTEGTEHFHHAHHPADVSVISQYGALPGVVAELGGRLEAVDAANGGSLNVTAVGDAVRDVLTVDHGTRPRRILVDAQQKGIEALIELHRSRQEAFLDQMGLSAMSQVSETSR